MNDKVKIAAIAGVAAVLCVGMVTYCSPYQSCVRELESNNISFAASQCARTANSN